MDCLEVGCNAEECPGHITCICPNKVPTLKLKFLQNQRKRGGGKLSYVHPSKIRAFKEKMMYDEQSTSAGPHIDLQHDLNDSSVDTSSNSDESYEPEFDDMMKTANYSKNKKKYYNLALAVMRHPEQSIRAAAEIGEPPKNCLKLVGRGISQFLSKFLAC